MKKECTLLLIISTKKGYAVLAIPASHRTKQTKWIYMMIKSNYYLAETPLFSYLADFRYLHELGHETSANLLSVSEFR